MKKFIYFAAIAAAFALTSCSDDDEPGSPDTPTSVDALFVVSTGN